MARVRAASGFNPWTASPAEDRVFGVRLTVIQGPDSGLRAEVGSRQFVIGRDPVCDLQLSDPDVSRRHAEIRNSGGGFEIADLGSRNGTLLNGHPVTDAFLRAGVEIRLGETVIATGMPAGSSESAGEETSLLDRPE